MSKARNFTLIELLVVIAIIGILASLLLPAIIKQTTAHASWFAGGEKNGTSVFFVDGHAESRQAQRIPSYWSYNTTFVSVNTYFWNGENNVAASNYTDM